MSSDISTISSSEKEIFLAVSRLIDLVPDDPPGDRRLGDRTQVTVSVEIQPLDDDFEPLGEIVQGVTSNLSSMGIGLIADEEIKTRYVQVKLFAAGSQPIFVVDIRHAETCGPFHIIGGEFVIDW